MKVLVTGAGGLVGRRLVARLAASGARVRALAERADEEGAAALAALGSEVARGDVVDPADVVSAVEGRDAVFHLAGVTSGRRRSRADYFRVNAQGTRNVARAAAAAGVAHVVYAGSVSVYGCPAHGGLDEGASPAPVNAYQASKLAGERALRDEVRARGLSVTIARLSALYGPGDGRCLGLFRDVARGRVLMVGRGERRTHLMHVDDAAYGLELCGARRGDRGEVFLLGGAEIVTVRALIDAIARALRVPRPRVIAVPEAPIALAAHGLRHLALRAARARRTVDAAARFPRPGLLDRLDFFLAERTWDTSKAERELGFRARVGLEAGLAETAAWYRERGWIP